MAGLGAGIRLAQFGQRVLIVEKHHAPGGLNSFYFKAGRKFDVGLHALTNYVPPQVKGTPLGRICRQLRIDREAFELSEQISSRIAFPGLSLSFTNDFRLLENEVAQAFPKEIDGFRRLAAQIASCDYFDSRQAGFSTRQIIADYLREPLLVDMLLCPLLYYGSARENDIDFDQFVILFKSIYQEGFARPLGGVRQIIRVLIDRYREVGGHRKMKCAVRRLHAEGDRIVAVELDTGVHLTAGKIFSTIGHRETLHLCHPELQTSEVLDRRLSFVETISILDRTPRDFGWQETIVFFNDAERFEYRQPEETLVDGRSGVICFPNNYRYPDGMELPEGIFRITALANYRRWKALDSASYRAAKEEWFSRLRQQALRFLTPVPENKVEAATLVRDMFTPLTIEKYTGHLEGAVYGAPAKFRDGKTEWSNLYLAGTDQGMLGIVGALHSGITVANWYGLGATPRSF